MSVTDERSHGAEQKTISLQSSRRNKCNNPKRASAQARSIILLIMSLLYMLASTTLLGNSTFTHRLAVLSQDEQASIYPETDGATVSEQSNLTNHQHSFSEQILKLQAPNETTTEDSPESLKTSPLTNQPQQEHRLNTSHVLELQTSLTNVTDNMPLHETNITSASIDGPQEQQPHTIIDSSLKNTTTSTTSNNESTAVKVTLQMAPQISALTHGPKEQPLNVTEQQPLNATQIVELLNSGGIQWNQTSKIFPKPAVDDYDIVSIYSQNAWQKLRNLLLNEQGEKVMVVNGGSSSTGAGRVETQHRFHYLFANSFRNVTVEDRAHGSRNTLHSYQSMHSFLPEHTDILLWEFAINDSVYHQTHNQSIKVIEARNQLILYLDQIARLTQQRQLANPPLVILVYLWTNNMYHQPFSNNFVYEVHQGIAEAYDFVVGHVNAMKYLESFPWEPNVTQTHFLADWTHPNSLTHHLIHDLMYDLVMNEERKERPKIQTQTRPSFVWACGEETHQKRLMRNLLVNHYPIASFTQEYPKNEVMLSGMIHPLFAGIKIQNLGKSDPLRIDRQFAATIPCCNSTSLMDFDHVSMHGTLHGMTVHVSPNASGLEIYFDNENVTDQLINCRNDTEWECFAADWYKVFFYWVILETPRNVSKISLCSNLPTCGEAQKGEDTLSILSLTVYGEDGQ